MSGKPKIGEGSLNAWLRQGFKEVAQALPAFKDSVQIVEEPGMVGNPTQQIVTEQIRERERTKQPEPEMEP